MNKLNKIFLIIIVILIIILIVAINRCFYFANAYKSVATNMMHLTEKANQIEKDYNRNTENVKIEIVKSSLTPTGATILITDNNEFPYIWKESYYLEKKENDSWKKLDLLQNPNFSDSIYKVNKNNQIEQVLDWNDIYGTLSKGTYRVIKYVYTSDSDIYFDSEEFEI